MGRYSGSLDRDLFQARVSGALVAAGLSVPIPARQNWTILGVTVLLTTTATVGNRRITVELLDSGDLPIAIVVSGQNVAASQTVSINFALGGFGSAVVGTSPRASIWDAWPVMVAYAGQRLRIVDQAGISITDTAKVLVSGEWEATA